MQKGEISITQVIYAALHYTPRSIEEIQSRLAERLPRNQFGVAMQSLMLQGAVKRTGRGMYARIKGVSFDPKPGRQKGTPNKKAPVTRKSKRMPPRVSFTKRDVDSMIAATKRLREENERRESGPITVRSKGWSADCIGVGCGVAEARIGGSACKPCEDHRAGRMDHNKTINARVDLVAEKPYQVGR